MAGNPLIDQGQLNKLRASVTWTTFPTLNVTAPYLGRGQINLALQGEASVYFPTATGAVPSLEPYMMIEMTVHLVKAQALAGAYKAQMELLAFLGSGIVRPDVSTGLTPYLINNCSIRGVRPMDFNGTDPEWIITVGGYYNVNAGLWDL
jgi:hypothetical protein